MRRGEIARLTLENVDFKNSRITFVQSKTSVTQVLPLRPVVGNAIFNYLMNERPVCDSNFLFVINTKIGVRPMTPWCVYEVMRKVFKMSGVRTCKGRKGVHIFRHHIASKLMCGNDSLEVTAVLGHTSPDSLDAYLSSDEQALKECAADIGLFPLNTKKYTQDYE